MAKNSTIKTETLSSEQSEVKKYGLIKVFKHLMVVIAIIIAVGVMVKNPQLLTTMKKWWSEYANPSVNEVTIDNNQNEIELLQKEISELRSELSSLSQEQNDIEELKNRFETMEKTNLGVLEAKADASTVLGVVTRLDKLEEKVETLARVTDDSALILTAVLMVKDTAERGTIFSYEAEILSQLAQNNLKIKEPIAVIEKTAVEGIKSDVYLVNSFADIYKEISKQQKKEFEKSWKDRINNKLNEFIKVRRTNQSVPEYEGNKPLDEIRNLVNKEDFSGALSLLNSDENKEWVEKYSSLKNWMLQVQNKLNFNAAIKQIANNSLAVMKVNSIKKEINND